MATVQWCLVSDFYHTDPFVVLGNKEIVDILLDNGADTNSPDAYQARPLHYAAQVS